jgi:hypothetical protein
VFVKGSSGAAVLVTRLALTIKVDLEIQFEHANRPGLLGRKNVGVSGIKQQCARELLPTDLGTGSWRWSSNGVLDLSAA